MSLPKPELGLVIHYAFLWNHEYQAGREEARKDRPCAIIASVYEGAEESGPLIVSVLPITHVQPHDETFAVEIPLQTKLRLGLDHDKSWIICNELNEFEWPGPDIRPIVGANEHRYAFGHLPPKLFNQVQQKTMASIQQRRSIAVKRSF